MAGAESALYAAVRPPGRHCRDMSNKAVAQLLHLHEHTVKDLDIRYMQAWLAKTPQPARVVGVDELSIKKGHTYRIVVSDLERGRPIWVGGTGRTEADLDQFFVALGPQKTARIRLAVMDMWKAFRNSVQTQAPQAQILFDKFHILRHLADAMDQVRRTEYNRVAMKDRAFIKGQRYTLLSHRANLTLAERPLASEAAPGQQATGHRLPAQGGVRPTLGLSPGRLGPPVLYPLARAAQMATAQTLREVCRPDRTALGRHRGVLHTPQQGQAGVRRRAE